LGHGAFSGGPWPRDRYGINKTEYGSLEWGVKENLKMVQVYVIVAKEDNNVSKLRGEKQNCNQRWENFPKIFV
jgi:hypothetical protein